MWWGLSAVFLTAAVPGVYRLVRGHPGSPLSCRVDRAGELAELLVCLGMVAMVSPVGGPIPLAGWRAVFGVAAVWLTAAWLAGLRWRGGADANCRSGRGHHAAMAVAMLLMLVPAAGHTARHNDPWLTMSGPHALPGPLALLLLGYCAADLLLCAARMIRHSGPRDPVLFGVRARTATRAAMSAGMAAMVLA